MRTFGFGVDEPELGEPVVETDLWTRFKRFVAYFHFIGWDHIQLGFHICLSLPNIEVHVPFGFIRIGWVSDWAEAQRVGS